MADNLSDEEIIARERRKHKSAAIAGLVFGLVSVVVISLAYLTRDSGQLAWVGLSPADFNWLICLLFSFLLLIFGWFVFRRFRPATEALSERVQLKRIDEFQSKSRIYLLFGAGVAGLWCFGVVQPGALIFIVFLMMVALSIAYGLGFMHKSTAIIRNDEFARVLRAQATRLGYLALMAALCLVYLAQAYRPALASLLVRAGLFAGIAIPVVSYLFNDWWAGRSG